MRTFAQLALVAWTLALMPVAARAQDGVPPESVAPEQMPPAGPAQPPAPSAQDQATAASPDASGQWVYTQQYGWVWMPYGDAYTYAPPEGEGQPYQYVYYPAYSGWTWVVAPWVWGVGPWPYFGVYGPARFAWYGYGWWRTPWRWHYHPAPYRSGFAVRGVGPAPYRGAFGAAPYRGAVGMRAAPAAHFAPRAFGGRVMGGGRIGGGSHVSVGHFGGHGGHR